MSGKQSIGIIDSGVGGLTVVKEVMRQLPREQIIYFGDNARCPYGSRTPEEIRQFTHQMIQFLFQFSLKALVIACNTAAAVALQEVQEKTGLPVIGVIEPGARAAISVTRTGRIGIIGTETTIRTESYERALISINPHLYVSSLACPAFVPLVENQLIGTKEARRIIRKTLEPLHYEELDTLILGCTHYPLFAPLIHEVMGDDITLISSNEETARELSALLSLRNNHSPLFEPVLQHRFFTSGDPELFRKIGEDWLDCEMVVEQRSLENMYYAS